MGSPITVDSAGRIVLPADVCRRLNLRAGSRLQLEVVAERIELTPETEAEATLTRSAGARTVLRATSKTSDAAAATRAKRRRGGADVVELLSRHFGGCSFA